MENCFAPIYTNTLASTSDFNLLTNLCVDHTFNMITLHSNDYYLKNSALSLIFDHVVFVLPKQVSKNTECITILERTLLYTQTLFINNIHCIRVLYSICISNLRRVHRIHNNIHRDSERRKNRAINNNIAYVFRCNTNPMNELKD